MSNPFYTTQSTDPAGFNSTKSAGNAQQSTSWFQSVNPFSTAPADPTDPAKAGAGEHYAGTLKHPNFGNQEKRLLITRLPPPRNQSGGARPQAEPQVTANLEGYGDIQKAFGKDGLQNLMRQVDQDGHLQGNVMMKDMNTGRFLKGEFQLKKYGAPAKPNAPDPADLAYLRFGSEKKDALRSDMGWRTYATAHGIQYEDKVAAQDPDPKWTRAGNNWHPLINEVNQDHANITREYTGQTYTEWRKLEPRVDARAANWLYDNTDGKMGVKWDDNQRVEIDVVDLFVDKSWGSPDQETMTNMSWWVAGNPELDYTTTVKEWKRLYDDEIGMPYQISGNANGPTLCARIFQGSLQDFYFVQACQIIATKPKLVEDIFMNCEFCNPRKGVFQMRFYKETQWVEVTVDGFLPYGKDDEPMCCRHENFPGTGATWPSLLEKAYAKLHGTWMALSDGGGDVEEVLTDLTGGCAGRFSATDVAADRMWKYMSCIKQTTLWGCNIDNNECSKRNIPIAKHWAAAIFDVATRPDGQNTPVVGVYTSAPFSSVRHFPLVDMGPQWADAFNQGYMWLRIDDFCQLFSDIYECRLVNTDLGIADQLLGEPIQRPLPGTFGAVPPMRPDRSVWQEKKTFDQGIGPLYEQLYTYQGDADMTSAPSFLMSVPPNTELIMSVGQQCNRFQSAQKLTVYRSDVHRGIYAVTYKEYAEYMRENFPNVDDGSRRRTRRELDDLWESLPRVKNPNFKPGETQDNAAYVVREPQAPLLLRFYQCSADMEFLLNDAPDPLIMPEAEAQKGELHMIHMSGWGHTRDSSCCVKVRMGGLYVAYVTMPAQYSCQKLSFRVYSNQKVSVSNFRWPRSLIVTNPGAPAGAFPYSLVGLPRIDSQNDRLPRTFDEDEGAGQPKAGPAWVQSLKKTMDFYEPNSMKNRYQGGPRVMGHF